MGQRLIQHSFYAVLSADDKYFKGFDAVAKQPIFVDDPLESKLFTNKYEVRLRPTERLVELVVNLTSENVEISEPFRPRYRPTINRNNQIDKDH